MHLKKCEDNVYYSIWFNFCEIVSCGTKAKGTEISEYKILIKISIATVVIRTRKVLLKYFLHKTLAIKRKILLNFT